MASNALKRPVQLVLDFDGTLTVKDTMSVLGRLPKTPLMTWQQISEAYMEDFSRHNDETFRWQNYDRKEYSQWLASRKWVEVRSAQRVQDAGFFKGVKLQEVRDTVLEALQSGELQLRSAWAELIGLAAHNAGSEVSIVSVNWSETFIRMTLRLAAENLGLRDLAKLIDSIPVHANEIDGLSAPDGSSGQVCRAHSDKDIRTSNDKLRHLPAAKEKTMCVYIGDSATDFDCLCAADLGVWLCDVPEATYQSTFQNAFKPLDFTPPPIRSSWNQQGRKPLFYWARSFDEIIEVLKTR